MKDYTVEGLRVIITPQSSDKLYTLAAEYSVSIDSLINLALKRMIEDIEFVRNLRTGKAGA